LFVDSPSSELRQSDICCVDRFPRWTLDSTTLSLPNIDRQILAVDQMTKIVRDGNQHLVCICSYDCELEGKDDRSGLQVAPIKFFPRQNSTERLERLRNSWRPVGFESMSDEEALSALDTTDDMAFADYNFFPLRLTVNGVGQDMVVDFASMMSLAEPKKAVPFLLSTKKFQMTDTARRFFQLKIALFMARPSASE
jgi:hypothetical protein